MRNWQRQNGVGFLTGDRHLADQVLYVEQRSKRVLFGLYRMGTVRLLCPGLPWPGELAFRQRNRARSHMTDPQGVEKIPTNHRNLSPHL